MLRKNYQSLTAELIMRARSNENMSTICFVPLRFSHYKKRKRKKIKLKTWVFGTALNLGGCRSCKFPFPLFFSRSVVILTGLIDEGRFRWGQNFPIRGVLSQNWQVQSYVFYLLLSALIRRHESVCRTESFSEVGLNTVQQTVTPAPSAGHLIGALLLSQTGRACRAHVG